MYSACRMGIIALWRIVARIREGLFRRELSAAHLSFVLSMIGRYAWRMGRFKRLIMDVCGPIRSVRWMACFVSNWWSRCNKADGCKREPGYPALFYLAGFRRSKNCSTANKASLAARSRSPAMRPFIVSEINPCSVDQKRSTRSFSCSGVRSLPISGCVR